MGLWSFWSSRNETDEVSSNLQSDSDLNQNTTISHIKRDEYNSNIDSANNKNATSLPDDLDQYLKNKESKLSDREFKKALKDMGDMSNYQKAPTADDLTNPESDYQKNNELKKQKIEQKAQQIQQEQQQQQQQQITGIPGNEDESKKHSVSEMFDVSKNFKPKILQSTERLTQDEMAEGHTVETYKRNYPLKESVLINCSEIQMDFMKCLSNRSFTDKFVNGECSIKAEFFHSCLNLQKSAFLLFDYPSMSKIEEFESIRGSVDEVFNKNFKCLDDVQNDEKYMNYTKDLRLSREEFFKKYNK
ncbi:unnamed protein product [[Candida] boidinii]|uniref:Unnamed protein product n=1 Tax=Candida boidinii TaxID=5477 RepID=A0A9W6T137_CANBO|nr:hypothetical protein B5S30_g2046 [[Candida] boidinii]OWB85766.1 hypothetical protein B5S33_g4437 [[Candida] boidinii]GME70679.1 unnamed protein product [[Candida] boidinii]GMF50858.1 unnamed protein product [[Candida] boidinii]GMG15324.1 unnamed protein product [[Candida] boidinii]